MRRIRNFILTGLLLLGIGGALAVPVVVHADTPKQVVCDSIGAGTDCADDPSQGTNVNKIIQIVVNILSFIVGITAVIMIMISGFKYITAGGDASKVSSAKNTLIYAIIGLVVVALAQFIVQFVYSKVTAPPPARDEGKQNTSLMVVPENSTITQHRLAYKVVEDEA
ncbi:hypothetical protein EYC59_00355 [Candidatus Saccharibacteria bacterium]|nr:MAG: hypothetical protein EYC59_00355 [Candidatus Saccharibacteria bacterium]